MIPCNKINNHIARRKHEIIKYLDHHLLKPLAGIISDYDYHFNGIPDTFPKNHNDSVDCIGIMTNDMVICGSTGGIIDILDAKLGRTLDNPCGKLGQSFVSDQRYVFSVISLS